MAIKKILLIFFNIATLLTLTFAKPVLDSITFDETGDASITIHNVSTPEDLELFLNEKGFSDYTLQIPDFNSIFYILIDNSGSIRLEDFLQIRKRVDFMLKNLKPGDYVKVLKINDSSQTLFSLRYPQEIDNSKIVNLLREGTYSRIYDAVKYEEKDMHKLLKNSDDYKIYYPYLILFSDGDDIASTTDLSTLNSSIPFFYFSYFSMADPSKNEPLANLTKRTVGKTLQMPTEQQILDLFFNKQKRIKLTLKVKINKKQVKKKKEYFLDIKEKDENLRIDLKQYFIDKEINKVNEQHLKDSINKEGIEGVDLNNDGIPDDSDIIVTNIGDTDSTSDSTSEIQTSSDSTSDISENKSDKDESTDAIALTDYNNQTKKNKVPGFFSGFKTIFTGGFNFNNRYLVYTGGALILLLLLLLLLLLIRYLINRGANSKAAYMANFSGKSSKITNTISSTSPISTTASKPTKQNKPSKTSQNKTNKNQKETDKKQLSEEQQLEEDQTQNLLDEPKKQEELKNHKLVGPAPIEAGISFRLRKDLLEKKRFNKFNVFHNENTQHVDDPDKSGETTNVDSDFSIKKIAKNKLSVLSKSDVLLDESLSIENIKFKASKIVLKDNKKIMTLSPVDFDGNLKDIFKEEITETIKKTVQVFGTHHGILESIISKERNVEADNLIMWRKGKILNESKTVIETTVPLILDTVVEIKNDKYYKKGIFYKVMKVENGGDNLFKSTLELL